MIAIVAILIVNYFLMKPYKETCSVINAISPYSYGDIHAGLLHAIKIFTSYFDCCCCNNKIYEFEKLILIVNAQFLSNL